MDIGEAIKMLRSGHQMTRDGWNGQGQYLELQVPDENSKMSLPYVFITTVAGEKVPWICSQTDLLAEDWWEVDRHPETALAEAAIP